MAAPPTRPPPALLVQSTITSPRSWPSACCTRSMASRADAIAVLRRRITTMVDATRAEHAIAEDDSRTLSSTTTTWNSPSSAVGSSAASASGEIVEPSRPSAGSASSRPAGRLLGTVWESTPAKSTPSTRPGDAAWAQAEASAANTPLLVPPELETSASTGTVEPYRLRSPSPYTAEDCTRRRTTKPPPRTSPSNTPNTP